jgi:hypothetical protein
MKFFIIDVSGEEKYSKNQPASVILNKIFRIIKRKKSILYLNAEKNNSKFEINAGGKVFKIAEGNLY